MPQALLITSGETKLTFRPDMSSFSARYPIVGGKYLFVGMNNPATIAGYGKWGTVKEAHNEIERLMIDHLRCAGLLPNKGVYKLESVWVPLIVPRTA